MDHERAAFPLCQSKEQKFALSRSGGSLLITLIHGDSTMKFDEIRQIFWFVLLICLIALSAANSTKCFKLGGLVDNNQYISWMAASGVLCGRGSDAVCVLLSAHGLASYQG
jgi:hypothetical protein